MGKLQRCSSSDGKGEFTVGDKPPIPVPAGTHPPPPPPTLVGGGEIFYRPRPLGESIPDGGPIPVRWRNAQMSQPQLSAQHRDERGSSGHPAVGNGVEQEQEGGTRRRNARNVRQWCNTRKGKGLFHSCRRHNCAAQGGEGPHHWSATVQHRKGRGSRLAGERRGAWCGGEDSLAAGGRLDFLKQSCRCGGSGGKESMREETMKHLGFGIWFLYLCHSALQLWADGLELKRGCGETGTTDVVLDLSIPRVGPG
jgi:hypothetical protein